MGGLSNTVRKVRSLSIDLPGKGAEMMQLGPKGGLVKWLHGDDQSDSHTDSSDGEEVIAKEPKSEPIKHRPTFLGRLPMSNKRSYSSDIDQLPKQRHSLLGSVFPHRREARMKAEPLLSSSPEEDEVALDSEDEGALNSDTLGARIGSMLTSRKSRSNSISAPPEVKPMLKVGAHQPSKKWSRFKTMAKKHLHLSPNSGHFDARAYSPNALSFEDCMADESLTRIFLSGKGVVHPLF